MRGDHGRFTDLGATVVAVGQGTAEQTRAFAHHMELPYLLLGDPARTAYAAYGLVRGTLRQLLGPAVIRVHLQGLVRGVQPGRIIGDPRQLPGAFVIDRAGMVRYAKPGKHAGDQPSTEELLRAVAAIGNHTRWSPVVTSAP